MTLKPIVVKGLKIAYPVYLEESYKQRLLRLVTTLKSFTLEMMLKNNQFQSSLNATARQDDILDDFSAISKSINAAISLEVSRIIKSVSQRFEAVRSFTTRSFRNSIEHIAKRSTQSHVFVSSATIETVDIGLLRKMWVENNTRLIKDIPALALEKTRLAVYDAASSGESIASLAKKIESIFDVTAKRAKLIARDQISKLKCDLSRHNDLRHGVTQYEWSTCKDGAVRKSHEVMQGKICSWLDATIYKDGINSPWKKRSSIGGVQKHAGEDILCRCTNIILMEVEQ